jgi:hypothetical protein
MTFAGIKDSQQRADLLAYLKETTKKGSPQTAQQGGMGGMGFFESNLWSLSPGRFTRSGQFLFTQQLRQLGDIRRDPPRLVLRQKFCGCAAARIILKVEVGQFLTGAVAHIAARL